MPGVSDTDEGAADAMDVDGDVEVNKDPEAALRTSFAHLYVAKVSHKLLTTGRSTNLLTLTGASADEKPAMSIVQALQHHEVCESLSTIRGLLCEHIPMLTSHWLFTSHRAR